VATKRSNLSDREVTLIARALADPRRCEILQQIGERDGELRCSEIRERHRVSAATLSHHMKELETAGLVESRKDGKEACYALKREVLSAYIRRLNQI
jgi:DNA-binding transcriptional ArsR family regulator